MEDPRFGRLVSVLVSPAKTFRSIADHPTWRVAITVLALSAVVIFVIAWLKVDWEEAVSYREYQLGRELTPEEKETFVQTMTGGGPPCIILIVAVLPWILCLLVARILLFGFRKMGGELELETSLSVLVHGLMPMVFKALLGMLFLFGVAEITAEEFDQGLLPTNLAFLAGENASPEWGTFLINMDLFSLWAIILLVIGYSIAAKVSKWRAAACVVGMWLLFVATMSGLVVLARVFG